jgi:predicted lipoprotein with Yx(FWY)xxD motif
MWRLVMLACVLTTGCAATAESRSAGSPSTSAAGVPSASASPSGRTTPTPTPTPAPKQKPGHVVIAADSAYGPMLYDVAGQPIYLFTAERGDRPACYDACAADWPPVLTRGEPRARGGVRDALRGVTRRDDGSRQVTYAGHPLYFYAHEGTYEVLCHDVVEYGGTWLVVRPDGTPAPA